MHWLALHVQQSFSHGLEQKLPRAGTRVGPNFATALGNGQVPVDAQETQHPGSRHLCMLCNLATKSSFGLVCATGRKGNQHT